MRTREMSRHRWRSSAVAVSGLLLLLVVVAAGCGSEESTTPTPGETAETTSSVSATSTEVTPVEPLVGEWERETTCAELVRAYRQAGFDALVPGTGAGNGFIPGVTSADQLADPEHHPCEGAVSRKHSHFFTSDGLFGSRDWTGNQVDEGTYEIIDDDTFVIGKTKFHYRIEGATLKLDPVLPKDCSTRRCRYVAAWSVSVAYPGEEWERVG